MNKTHQLFLLFLGLLLSAGCLFGCIKDDLSDCPISVEPEPEPTTGIFRLALTYTMHNTQENGTYVDLFNQQVRKVDVFVFDESGQFVKQITEEASPIFAENYTKDIELPGGNYQFVVWGNHYENETVHNYTDAVTLLEEGRMTLLQTLSRGAEIGMLTDSLFHGCTSQTVTVENGKEQTVPIDLMKNRNDVRVIVRWRGKGMTEGYCTHPEHAQNITATLIDNNAVYDFMNNVVEKQEVTYQPGRFPEWYNPFFHGKMDVYPTEQEHVYVADFSELRLMKDNADARLVIRNADDEIVYEHALTGPNGLITRLEEYQTQEALDREDRYLIELLFECGHVNEPDDPGTDEPDNPGTDEPDDPGTDEPDGPGTDEPDGPGTDEPDGPGTDPTPVPEDSWSSITITVNGWTMIDKDIEL